MEFLFEPALRIYVEDVGVELVPSRWVVAVMLALVVAGWGTHVLVFGAGWVVALAVLARGE